MNARKRILIADSDNVNREFFELMLSKLGFLVEQAVDGAEALEKVKKFHPDLVILDNVLPRISGWELTKTLKNDAKYRNISIIMISALDNVKDKVAGFELGVDDYITKPFNFTEVLARIKAVLRHRELIAQIAVRESRLRLAEDLGKDLRKNLSDFNINIDELDGAIAGLSKSTDKDGKTIDQKSLAKSIKALGEKSQSMRKHIAGLDARIEKTVVEWNDLKKNEIGLSVIETQIRKFLNQEQEYEQAGREKKG